MKKLILILLLSFLFIPNVMASGLTFSFEDTLNGVNLIVLEDGKVVTYDYAEEKYNLNRYTKFKYNSKDVYFESGREISEDEYLIGYEEEKADNRAELDEDGISIRVHDTNEFIDAIESIYNNKKNGKYKLVYSKYEYEEFNLNKINRYYKNNILTDLDTNMYEFDDYGILFPTRYVPVIGEEETVINFNNVMISDDELKSVELFMDSFLPYFEGKTDYEKILGVYSYIRSNSKYVSDNGYENMNSAYLSPYDVLIHQSYVCIGASTTFQYIMEELDIDSYIVDRVSGINIEEKYFATSHTYNVVKLDGRWYIVDIANDVFLGINDGEYSEDTYSKYIRFANKPYIGEGNIFIDYNKLNEVINTIKGNEVVEEEEINNNEISGTKEEVEENKEDKSEKKVEESNEISDKVLLKYTLVILMLIGIFIVVFFVTK